MITVQTIEKITKRLLFAFMSSSAVGAVAKTVCLGQFTAVQVQIYQNSSNF